MNAHRDGGGRGLESSRKKAEILRATVLEDYPDLEAEDIKACLQYRPRCLAGRVDQQPSHMTQRRHRRRQRVARHCVIYYSAPVPRRRRNAQPATPSRVGRSDKMSDLSSNGTVIAGKRTNLQGSDVEP